MLKAVEAAGAGDEGHSAIVEAECVSAARPGPAQSRLTRHQCRCAARRHAVAPGLGASQRRAGRGAQVRRARRRRRGLRGGRRAQPCVLGAAAAAARAARRLDPAHHYPPGPCSRVAAGPRRGAARGLLRQEHRARHAQHQRLRQVRNGAGRGRAPSASPPAATIGSAPLPAAVAALGVTKASAAWRRRRGARSPHSHPRMAHRVPRGCTQGLLLETDLDTVLRSAKFKDG